MLSVPFLLRGALILYVFPGTDPFHLSFQVDRGELFTAARRVLSARGVGGEASRLPDVANLYPLYLVVD